MIIAAHLLIIIVLLKNVDRILLLVVAEIAMRSSLRGPMASRHVTSVWIHGRLYFNWLPVQWTQCLGPKYSLPSLIAVLSLEARYFTAQRTNSENSKTFKPCLIARRCALKSAEMCEVPRKLHKMRKGTSF
jgi:hypothetical protein